MSAAGSPYRGRSRWRCSHPRWLQSVGLRAGSKCALRASGAKQDATESLDWGQSIPSYLQSTIATELCDEWSEAIADAEAAADARTLAIAEGRDPDSAEKDSRAAARAARGDRIWARIRDEASVEIEREPILSSFLYTSILSHSSFAEALCFVLSNRIADNTLLPTQLFSLFMSLAKDHVEVLRGAMADLEAVFERDPACHSYSQALLYLKGYHALQIYRFAHALWHSGRTVMALALQSRLSEVLAVDIHPAAHFGRGILLDHGTGVVIGETAVVGNGVSLMQNVTLGGTGKEVGDRHPKVCSNVLIGAGASILGNITIGHGAQVAAGSLVLKPVEPHTMVAGSPAKCVGGVRGNPAAAMKQWMDHADTAGKAGSAPLGAGRIDSVVETGAGGQVRRFTAQDFQRLRDAEAELLGSASGGGARDGVPAGGEGGGKGDGVAAEEGQRVNGTAVMHAVIESTTSDTEAAQRWGPAQPAPEFFI